jgi:hypothetical protein
MLREMGDIGHAQDRPEPARERNLLLGAQALVAKEQDKMIEERLLDLCEGAVVKTGKIDARDLRADRPDGIDLHH